MQKSLFTEGTLIRKTTFVRLQMIMHRVLVLLNNVTLWANIVSIRILRVRIGHSSHVGGVDQFNFYTGTSRYTPFRE